MSLRRPNDLLSDDDGLTRHDRVRIAFIAIGALTVAFFTDGSGLFFGSLGGYLAFELLVYALTLLGSFFSGRRH